jgi:hypothetical protein
MDAEEGLDPDSRAQGFVLTCVGHPENRSACPYLLLCEMAGFAATVSVSKRLRSVFAH